VPIQPLHRGSQRTNVCNDAGWGFVLCPQRMAASRPCEGDSLIDVHGDVLTPLILKILSAVATGFAPICNILTLHCNKWSDRKNPVPKEPSPSPHFLEKSIGKPNSSS